MIRFEVTVKAAGGLHARPAALLVNIAAKSQSQVTVTRSLDDKQADGKSILGMLTLGAGRGEQLVITVEGPDEEQVAHALQELFEQPEES